MLKKLHRIPTIVFLWAMAIAGAGYWLIGDEQTTKNGLEELRAKFNDKHEGIERISNYCVRWPDLDRIERDGTYSLATPSDKFKKRLLHR